MLPWAARRYPPKPDSFWPSGFVAVSARILDLSADLPIVIEIVDEEEQIERVLPVLHDLYSDRPNPEVW